MANKKNYNKISEEAKTEPVEVEETPMVVAYVPRPTKAPEVVEEPKAKFGKVSGCTKLNVRKAPKSDAPVRRVINANTEVEILEDAGDFYKIGNGEYCMKSFITVV